MKTMPGVKGFLTVPADERFWSHVNKNGPVSEFKPELGPCWVWTAGTNQAGYGRMGIGSLDEAARFVAADVKPENGARQTCTDHCTSCGAHFHGLSAFDAHRQDGQCVPPSSATASKGKNQGVATLQAWTDAGWCDKLYGCWIDGKRVQWAYPVTVWQRAGQSIPDAWRSAGQEKLL